MGLNKIKTELENLSFKYEHPDDYAAIQRKLEESHVERDDIIDKFTPAICQKLDEMGVKYTLKARIKSPYSIWCKMQKKHIPFEEVFDILAIRIVFTPADRAHEKDECFRIYSALTEIYKPHPTRFRDWLSNPKTNGYQALHNTFMSKQGKWIEVQIRSDRMDDIAEVGFAAHWKYKDKDAEYDENELDKWLNSIKEILDDPQPDTLDLLDNIKLNLYASEIMVFTPKGELKTMPKGATALDFAYSIHSFLGSHCFGAKVNHRLVPLSYVLKSGDQVEVLTSRNQHVQPEWLGFATTAKARAKIQAYLRRDSREKQKRGEEMLRNFVATHDMEYTSGLIDKLRRCYNVLSNEEFLFNLGDEKIQLNFLQGRNTSKGWRRFLPSFMEKKSTDATHTLTASEVDNANWAKNLNRKEILVLNEDVLRKCSFEQCCAPIPGDDVLGYITDDGTLQLHKRSCDVAVKCKTRYGNNIIACRWDTHKVMLFDVKIEVRGVDSQGVLYAIADVLHKLTHFTVKRITLDTNDGIFDGQLTISVYDTNDVESICNQLKQIENVTEAVRV